MKYYCFLLLCSLLYSCYEAERNCKDFHTGSFEFSSISSKGDTLKTFFTRTKNLEIDYFDNKIDSSYVNWVSECECILKKVSPKNSSEKKAIQMKILSTFNNEYIFEYSYVGDSENTNRGKAKKISDTIVEK